jgi:hypothetical protein
VFCSHGGGACIATWRKEACIPSFNPVNECEQLKVRFVYQQGAARAVKWMRDTYKATLFTNCRDCLRWRKANLDGTLNEERNEISATSPHFGTHQDGDPWDLRVTCALRAINAIVISDSKMRDPARGGGAR